MTVSDMPILDKVIDPIKMEYRRLFDSFDVEKSGYIDIEVLRDLFNLIGLDSDIESMRNSNLRHERDCKKINFNTFISIMNSIDPTELLEEGLMHSVFREFDSDNDGFISNKDLQSLLSKIGEDLSENMLQEMIKEADKDGDGKVSFNEFIQIIKFSPSTKRRSSFSKHIDSQKSVAKVNENISLSEKRNTNSSSKCKPVEYCSNKSGKASSRRRSSYALKIHDLAVEIRSSITVMRIMSKGSWK